MDCTTEISGVNTTQLSRTIPGNVNFNTQLKETTLKLTLTFYVKKECPR